MAKIYMKDDVFTAAQKRVSRIFDEFEHIIVGFSGGKDSTVVFNLCMAEATKRGRLPLEVCWIDQEGEWQHTADYVKSIMYRKDVKPYWLQFPIILFNATSHESDNWLHCWEENGEWIRDKDPISIKVNNTGTNRFHAMFPAFVRSIYPDDYDKACIVGGVRCEESPQRARGLTSAATYKEITWGKNENGVISFYPIYDWSYTDVWHAIFVNKWKYNTIYDEFYKLGVPVARMRVSNLHHETAVKNLDYVQEIEPKTWNKLVARLAGIHTTAEIDYDDNFKPPKTLPFMFKDWKEYRDYLLEKLIVDPEQRETYRKQFEHDDKKTYGSEILSDALIKCHIASMLANDYTFTKINNFWCQHGNIYDKVKKGQTIKGDNKFIRDIMEEVYD